MSTESWNESIYNWIPKELVKPVKPPRYVSKHDPKLPPTGSTIGLHGTTKIPGAALGEVLTGAAKSASGVFGPSASAKPDPKTFLKKGTVKPVTKETVQRARTESSKPTVPSRSERPVMGLQTSKNFVVANAVENILSVPKPLSDGKIDYTKKPDYGKVPEYLSDIKKQIDEETKMISELFIEEKKEDSVGEALSEEDRAKLLYALKVKWDDVNKKFQRMAHQTKVKY
jgi:hypothetical protein